MLRLTPYTLTRQAVRVRARTCAPAPAQLRALSATAGRLHKETLSHNTDNIEHDIEKLKQDSLKMQKEGKGEWMAGLASDSEESVKADKDWAPPKTGAAGGQTKK